MPEYIYLCQERDFIKKNANIYKVGKTKHNILNKIHSCINGNLLLQMMCVDSNKIEKNIISLFKDKYEQQKDIGDEYFEGDHENMLYDIRNIILNETEEEVSYDQDNMTMIQKIFPNYTDDECFDGTKKLIKFRIDENVINTYYISNKDLKEDILQKDWFKKTENDRTDYISQLIKNDVIKNYVIYNFNDTGFIKSLNRHKIKINIENIDEDMPNIIEKFKEYKRDNNIEYKIDKILCNNCILNDEIYCEYMCDILRITFPDYDNPEEDMVIKRIDIKKTLIEQ